MPWRICGILLIVVMALGRLFDSAGQQRVSPFFLLCCGMSLVIRREQVETFKAALRVKYVQQMVAHLHARFPEECQRHGYNSQVLTDLVSHGITAAESYGIWQAHDRQLYLECLALLGSRFDTEIVWATRILSQSDVEGTAKMDAIHEHLVVTCVNEHSKAGRL